MSNFNVVNPENSFVKFYTVDQLAAMNEASCVQEYEFKLPIFYKADWKFQIGLEGDKEALDGFFGVSVPKDSNVNLSVVDEDGQLLYIIANPPEAVRTSATTAAVNFVGGFEDAFDDLPIWTCFKCKATFASPSAIVETYSNTFQKIEPECFISTIEYYDLEDNFGFSYCGSIFNNKARLPFFLAKPQFPFDEEVYIKANGDRRTTSLTINKEYEAKTDYLPQEIHQALAVALKHDSVFISSGDEYGSFRLNGAYDIDWTDFINFPLAVAKFKAFQTDFTLRKNNCQDCTPYFEMSLKNDFLGTLVENTAGVAKVLSNDFIYCDNPILSISYANPDFLVSYNEALNKEIVYRLKEFLTSTNGVLLFKYQVKCGEAVAEASVFADIKGTAELNCPIPTGLNAAAVEGSDNPMEYLISWNAANQTDNNFFWKLSYDIGGALISSGNTKFASVNINHLPYNTALRFEIQHICSPTIKSPFVVYTFTTPAQPSLGNGRIQIGSKQIYAFLERPLACDVTLELEGNADFGGTAGDWYTLLVIPAGSVTAHANVFDTTSGNGGIITCCRANETGGKYVTVANCAGIVTQLIFYITNPC